MEKKEGRWEPLKHRYWNGQAKAQAIALWFQVLSQEVECECAKHLSAPLKPMGDLSTAFSRTWLMLVSCISWVLQDQGKGRGSHAHCVVKSSRVNCWPIKMIKRPKSRPSHHQPATISNKEGFWSQSDGTLAIRTLFGSIWGKKMDFFNESDKEITENINTWRPEGTTTIICSGF